MYQFLLDKPLPIDDPSLEIADHKFFTRVHQQSVNATGLDDFEGCLQSSGQLLLSYQNQLLLFQPNRAVPIQQSAPKDWKFSTDLEEGAVQVALNKSANPIRAFLPGVKNQLKIEQYRLLDDEEKTLARCTLYHLKNSEHQVIFGLSQGLRGYDSSHQLLIDALSEYGAVRLDSYAPIYHRCGFAGPLYNAKPTVNIEAEAAVIDTTVKLIASSLNIARINEDGVKHDYDTEFLHDYRVNLRKVRSILSLFKGVFSAEENQALKNNFSEIMKQTNRLRDLDVYLLDKDELFQLLPDRMHLGLQQMFDAFATERKQQLRHVIKMLNSKSYHKNIENLCQQFTDSKHFKTGAKAQTASLPFATKLIWKRYSKVCQIARQIDADTPDEEVHELRIQCKKLRYLMEFFSALFPKNLLKGLIRSLKRLQDNLGRFNDFSVQQESLQEFLTTYAKKHRNKNLIAMAESIGALIILLQQKQAKERAQVMQSFARFDSPEIKNQFSEIFHHGVNQ